MVAQLIIQVGVHHLADTRLYIVAVDIAPSHGHLRSTDDVGETFVFIAERFGNDEGDVHVATFPHSSGESVAGSAEAT